MVESMPVIKLQEIHYTDSREGKDQWRNLNKLCRLNEDEFTDFDDIVLQLCRMWPLKTTEWAHLSPYLGLQLCCEYETLAPSQVQARTYSQFLQGNSRHRCPLHRPPLSYSRPRIACATWLQRRTVSASENHTRSPSYRGKHAGFDLAKHSSLLQRYNKAYENIKLVGKSQW